jgi:hypothetical protein
MLPNFVAREIYKGVECIEAEQPFHLGPGAEWMCIGDGETKMVTSGDVYSTCSKPFVFANLSRRGGVTAFFTGLIWRDSVLNRGTCQNKRFMENFVRYVDRHQLSSGLHRRQLAVFISYSHADASLATAIAGALERTGSEVWLDEKRTNLGSSISAECRDGIRRSDRFLLVISPSSIESEWVKWEYELAKNLKSDEERRDWFIPVVTGMTSAEVVSRMPEMRDIKYADLAAGESHALSEIVKAVG